MGLVVILELYLAHLNRHGDYAIGQDVHQVLRAAARTRPSVTTVFLGDSVSHQLFHPEAETSSRVLYLTSNQAISLAGQFCLLKQAIAHCPHLREADFLYTPYSWSNNLDQIFTHDYFCGYFHQPGMVWEVWQLKHDRDLLGAHVGRMLLPNTMAMNSYLNRGQSHFGVPTTIAFAGEEKPMSLVSTNFLAKMRELCRQRGIRLRVLPCPCFGSQAEFAPVAPAYDVPVRLFDPSLFVADHIHLKKDAIEPVRRQLIALYHLPS